MGAAKKDTVLIVEDEPGIAQLLAERLSKLGLDVSLADSAEEAERRLADNSPSLILLDYSLPGKSGIDFIETLKAGRAAPPPFIVTTGRGDERLAVTLMKMGAWDYLVKDGDFLDKVGPASQKAIRDAGLRAELERKETVLTEVIKASKDPIFALDTQLRYIAFNPAYAEAMREVYGGEVEPGGTLPEAVGEPVRSALIANVLRALAGEAFSVEVQLGGETQGRRWFDLKYAPLRAQSGGVIGVSVIGRDVTARKLMENQLLEKNELFSRILGSSGGTFFSVRPDGAYLFFNETHAALMKQWYGRDIEIGKRVLDYIPDAAVADRFRTRLARGLAGEEYVEEVEAKREGTGLTHYFEVLTAPVRGERGEVIAVSFAGRDITERKKVEAERQLLSETLAASLNEIYIFDAKTLKFRFLNRGALENTGYTQEEAAGMTPLDLKPDLTADEFVKYTGPLLSGEKKVQVFETRHRRKDGSLYPVEVHLQYEPANAVFLAVINDITYKKRMESDLMRSQKIESLGLLAGGIAHDFNNMLTGITANLSLLAARNPGAADLVGDSLAAAKAAQSLTAQLLSFSKGGKPVKKEFSAGRALREIFSLATRGASVNQRLDIPEGLWSVDGDENQIKQALNNLLLNALQAMPSGGTLTMKAENAQAGQDSDLPVRPGKYLRVTVSDTGIGIPEDYLSRIFEPYFTTKTKGHGLGLPMTWSVIKNHGGYIDADSVPGEGTRFVIYLPATGRFCAEEADAAQQAPRGSGRVLVLEDEEIVSRAAKRMLSELGYSGEFTEDGADTIRRYAEEKAAGRPFDAVILDLTIPGGMGGKEAGRELRRLHPEAVLIVSSGYSEEAVMADFKPYGFDAVLPKPYRYEELAETLAKLVRKGK